jgi:hypothetical protein
MIEVKNLLFQPLTFHLRDGQESLHLGPRQRREIEDGQVSPELRQAERRGMVALTEKSGNPEPDGEISETFANRPVKKRPASGLAASGKKSEETPAAQAGRD